MLPSWLEKMWSHCVTVFCVIIFVLLPHYQLIRFEGILSFAYKVISKIQKDEKNILVPEILLSVKVNNS